MTDLDDIPGLFIPTTEPVVSTSTKKCKKHVWKLYGIPGTVTDTSVDAEYRCKHCDRPRNDTLVRQNKNNRSRGNREELTVARAIGGRKVGPLGHPWDVEMPGYARLQVRKYATPQGLRAIGRELARIGSGAEMPGYVWVEPGRGGEQLIVFRLRDFAERHGIPEVGE